MIYAVNLLVDTKTTDLYDKVAVNKYPIIVICKDENELWEKLILESTRKWLKENIRTKRLFDSAYFYIREISKEGNVKDICWKVDSLITNIF